MFMVGCWYTAGIPPVTSGMPLVIKKSINLVNRLQIRPLGLKTYWKCHSPLPATAAQRPVRPKEVIAH